MAIHFSPPILYVEISVRTTSSFVKERRQARLRGLRHQPRPALTATTVVSSNLHPKLNVERLNHDSCSYSASAATFQEILDIETMYVSRTLTRYDAERDYEYLTGHGVKPNPYAQANRYRQSGCGQKTRARTLHKPTVRRTSKKTHFPFWRMFSVGQSFVTVILVLKKNGSTKFTPPNRECRNSFAVDLSYLKYVDGLGRPSNMKVKPHFPSTTFCGQQGTL